MKLINKIKETELKYKKLTSIRFKGNNYTIFKDIYNPDVPLQNFIFIDRNINDDELKELVEKERSKMTNNKKDFIRFVFDPYSQNAGEIPELSDFYFSWHYVLTVDLNNSKFEYAHKNCTLLDRQDKSDLERFYKKLYCDRDNNSHIERWIDIKLRKEKLDTLVYKNNNTILGSSELFYNDNIVKLEDLEVIPESRKKGIGDAIFNSAIAIAKSSGADILYLVANRDNEVVDFYLNRGATLFTEYNSAILYR